MLWVDLSCHCSTLQWSVLLQYILNCFQEFDISCEAKRKTRKSLFSLFPQTSAKKELLAKAAEAHVNGFKRAMSGQGKIVIISST